MLSPLLAGSPPTGEFLPTVTTRVLSVGSAANGPRVRVSRDWLPHRGPHGSEPTPSYAQGPQVVTTTNHFLRHRPDGRLGFVAELAKAVRRLDSCLQ